MTQRRRGFSLVEVLVSMALTIFIMTIMAQCFIMGTDTFRTLKAVGDLNASLRTATTTLRADLAADHFDGKRRLSSGRFWLGGPPQAGYFFIFNSAAGANEGTDPDGVPSRRRTATYLAFTVKLKGNRPQDFFSIQVPPGPLSTIGNPDSRFQQPGSFNSQWAEVCYFLASATPGTEPVLATAGGTPLFALYRQHRLVVADVEQLNWGNQKVPLTELAKYEPKVSCYGSTTLPGFIYFNSPLDLTIPDRRRFGGVRMKGVPSPPPPLHNLQTFERTGEDLLLTDVLSFDVQVLLSTDTSKFVDLMTPKGANVFDTWSNRTDDRYDYSNKPNPTSLAPATILALQITLRVWDPKSKITRQITMIQDM